MYIAFYKGKKGNFFDKAISIWTLSKYSHCELLDKEKNFYTSSPRDGGVRRKKIDIYLEKWDLYKLNIKSPQKYKWLKEFYETTKGAEYDWLGIVFSEVFPFGIEDPNKYYCSEWCLYYLKYFCHLDIEKTQISPGGLFKLLKKKGIIT